MAILYLRALRPRLLERPLWRMRYRHGFPPSDPGRFASLLPGGIAGQLSRVRERLGGLTASSLRATQLDQEGVLAAATRTGQRSFNVLGSGPVTLGTPINWQRDFVHDRTWDRELFWEIDYTELGRRSDVKIPWELARCHWALWLAEAWLLTGEDRHQRAFVDLVTDWLDGNPTGMGVHWACPMELSIRAINLLLASAVFAEDTRVDQTFWGRLLESLWWHGRVIRWNLEYSRRLNNHYVTNALGLFILGLAFREVSEGRRWFARGRAILEEQVTWQVHPDGVSYEKSVSYHRLVLECFALAMAVGMRNGIGLSASYQERLLRMHEFTAAYTREDGTTPLVSDADDGRIIRPDPTVVVTDHRHALSLGALLFHRGDWKAQAGGMAAEVPWLLGPAGPRDWETVPVAPANRRSRAFPQGGFYVLQGDRTHTFLDAGPLGFEGDSVHGHLDTLSLELWAPGGVFLSDAGTYCYTSDPGTAMAFASTASHNTVMVDGKEIADWTSFWHVKKDGTRPRVLAWSIGEIQDVWEAEHYGYTRLPSPVIHRRKVVHRKLPREWVIEDTLSGSGSHWAELRWHLGPGASVRPLATNVVEIDRGDGCIEVACNGSIQLVPDWVAPSYGVKLASWTILVRREGVLPLQYRTEIRWRPTPRPDLTEEPAV